MGEGGPPAGSEVMDPEPGLPNGSSPEPRRRAEAPYRQRAGVEKPEQTTAYGRPAKTHEGRLAAVDKASETSGRTEKKKEAFRTSRLTWKVKHEVRRGRFS